MNRREYQLLAGVLHRTRMVTGLEKNKIKREAKLHTLNLVTTDLIATLKHEYPNFNEQMFREASGS